MASSGSRHSWESEAVHEWERAEPRPAFCTEFSSDEESEDETELQGEAAATRFVEVVLGMLWSGQRMTAKHACTLC
eukprot:13708409-Alexandrium_andersonii.AAC.1